MASRKPGRDRPARIRQERTTTGVFDCNDATRPSYRYSHRRKLPITVICVIRVAKCRMRRVRSETFRGWTWGVSAPIETNGEVVA